MSQVYHFEWRLRASPRALWPYVSDTQRLNEAIGLPEWRFTDRATAEGVARDGRFDYLGVLPIEWEEKPFEWTLERELGVERLYRTGPIKRLRSHVQLVPEEAGTRLRHSLEFEPRALVWSPVARYELGVKTRRRLEDVYQWIDRHLAGGAPTPFPQKRPKLARGAEARLALARPRLEIADGFPSELVDRALRLVTDADDRALARIRPLELADRWGRDRATVLRLFLAATRRGLFSLAWDLVCPSCRGAKARLEDLARLGNEAHCASCDVRIDSSVERSLELVFTVSPRIRPIDVRSHCVGGPGNTPHVVLQRRLAPGERVVLGAALAPGTYRLRGPGVAAPAHLEATAAPPGRASFRLSGPVVAPGEARIPTVAELELANDDRRERLVILERADWHDDAVTVGRALSLQDFADFFPGQVPPPSLGLEVARLAVLGLSTDMGAALAHLDPDERARVSREAYSLVAETARASGGGIVKGEPEAPRGVHLLAFPGPGEGIAGGLAVLGALVRFSRDRDLPDLVPRAALEVGPCVATSREARAVLQGSAVAAALGLVPAARAPGALLVPRPVLDEAASEIVLRAVRSPAAAPEGERRELVSLANPDPTPAERARRAEERTSEDALATLQFQHIEMGSEIGRGAGSVVHRARDRRSGQALAVKLQSAPDGRARARQERELRAYAKLDGVPGIVPLRGHGVHGDRLWMAFDLVEGEDLEKRLGRAGPLGFREAAQTLVRVARALHAAHTRGVIHRDVKPANVILDSSGASWLVDFGVAGLLGEERPGTGRYSGTAAYLAPEAFDEEPVLDARSDIYALGVTFYEIVSGRLPFSASSAGELVMQVMSESSPLLHEVAVGASSTAAAVARCALRKRPQDRYRNANEMALDLELLVQGQTPLHAPAIGDDGETTYRFKDLFFRRGVAAAAREKSREDSRS